MDERASLRQPSLSVTEWAGLAALTALVVYLTTVALRLQIDYFDAYENLLNAGRMVHDGSFYSIARAIFYPALLTPIALIARAMRSPEVAFTGAHVLAVVMFAAFLFAVFKLFRRYLLRASALAAVVLLSWNLLLIGNAPLAKEDIPGALFLTAGFYWYLRGDARRRPLDLVVAGALIAAAIGSRYNLLPLPFATIALYELIRALLERSGTDRPGLDVRFRLIKVLSLFVMPVALFLLLAVIVYRDVGRASLIHAVPRFVDDLRFLVQSNASIEDPVRNYRFVLESMTAPLLLVAALGAVTSLRSRRRTDLFFGIWLLLFFLFQTYVIAHKEARYLFATFPALYFFVGRGLEDGWRWISRIGLPNRRLVAALAVAAVGLWPAWNALAAIVRFQDPVYVRSYEAAVSEYALQLGAGGRVAWVGAYYTLHPHDYLFDRDDPFTFLFHYYSHVAHFWARWPIDPVLDVSTQVADGDVLIINVVPRAYGSGDLPSHALSPLVVARVRQILKPDSAATTAFTGAGGARVDAMWQGPTSSLHGTGLPDGRYLIYGATSASPPLSPLGAIQVIQGSFDATVSADAGPFSAILLLDTGSLKTFPPPA